MRKVFYNKLVLLSIGLTFSSALSAREWIGDNNNNSGNTSNTGSRAADCAPASGVTTIEFNNVSAVLENSGLLWMNRSAGAPAYVVPKGGGASPIFAGALWLGGTDVNNQLKLAGTRFRSNGDDFWPGPLGSLDQPGDGEGIRPFGGATTDRDECKKWDKFYEVRRSDVEQFVAWYDCKIAGPGVCDLAATFPNYSDATIPDIIKNWGDIANGLPALGQDQFLAPFYDRNGDGSYDYNDGDYPGYDILEEVDCRTSRRVSLFGDYTIWWIFNDVGNIHTETGGDEIGMEIRAQAFAFATNDEVNNMTFYNYELVNRSSNTLFNTYFGQYVDTDLGCAQDDYVGCDVSRGLGFAYNADAVDDQCNAGSVPYGTNPPAIGVDFFEGPYQDNNNFADQFYENGNGTAAQQTQAVPGNGIGYGDSIIDNERFGMRKFVYYNNSASTIQGDPDNFVEYYNYLQGRWKNGQAFVYGGTGVAGSPGSNSSIETDFCFPSDPATGVGSDVEGWGTRPSTPGSSLPVWSEVSENNPAGDRRMLQSAGPFTLAPGALNNITVGVVYARGANGNLSSIEKLKFADDKAQRLFDNCFEILEGPDAPQLTIQELENELILMIDPTAGGGDIEAYIKKDPNIVIPNDADTNADEFYRFEGYQIFQMVDDEASVSELNNPDKARLVAQVDIENGITQLINYEQDGTLGVDIPEEKVNGNDEGLQHTFRVTRDLFAQGDDQLINHKNYYFIAISYGHNNYKTFNPSDPNALDGQKQPYIPSRTTFDGKEIRSIPGTPHKPTVERGGTVLNAQYGDGVQITRVEGRGNGGNELDLTDASRLAIATNFKEKEITYKAGKGPINVKVVDPLNVIADDFEFRFVKDANNSTDSADWVLIRKSNGDTIKSNKSIEVLGEQYFPDYGFSITIEQYKNPTRSVDTDPAGGLGESEEEGSELITWSLTYDDPSKAWLTGIADNDFNGVNNWIRSGTSLLGLDQPNSEYNDWAGLDDEQQFEEIAGGTFAPFRLLPRTNLPNFPTSADMYPSAIGAINELEYLRSVDIVMTKDKSLWTRCPVLEAQDQSGLSEGNARKLRMRNASSVDKDGKTASEGGNNSNLISATGMGWFPGYAIDIETGERLNMAFAEDSYLAADNGRDMKFNPTSTFFNGVDSYIAGGKHFVYVFRNSLTTPESTAPSGMREYNGGQNIYDLFNQINTQGLKIWGSCMYVGIPVTIPGQDFLSTDATLKIRVKTSYERYATVAPFYLNDYQFFASNPGGPSDYENEWYGLYKFNTGSVATTYESIETAENELDIINVVPNPYYAYSNYESSRLDNTVKITNLPDRCDIRIYTVNGTLVRTFNKDDGSVSSIDWDLKNFKGVPIASGVYLIHVEVPGVGETILKWFGSLRPPDLTNF